MDIRLSMYIHANYLVPLGYESICQGQKERLG